MKSDYIYEQEVDELIAALPYEYRGIVIAAAETGFRINDLCRAEAWRYDPKEGTITLKEQKTGKIRTAAVTPRLKTVLEGIDGRGIERLVYATYLFEHDGHKPISRTTVWRWIKRTWERLHGTEARNISPHSMRKHYAVTKRRSGVRLADIQRDLNHDKIETTMIYAYADILHEAERESSTNATYVPVI